MNPYAVAMYRQQFEHVPLPTPAARVGLWFARKYRTRMQDSGAGAVARQLRKQGVPLDVALLLLFGRAVR